MTVYLTPVQVAERTGFEKQTLANWRAQKVGPPYLKVGRLVRYVADDVDAWMQSQPTTTQPAATQ